MIEPLTQYENIQPLVQLEINNAMQKFTSDRKFDVAQIPAHSHNGIDSGNISFDSLENISRYVLYRIVGATVDTTVANVVGGDFVMPFGGYITDVGATVDTAGTTGTTTVDINQNGTSIMTVKITIDSTEKTSRSAATPAVIKTSLNTATNTRFGTFVTGDIFTFDIDAISSTPAKGLTVFMNVIQTT